MDPLDRQKAQVRQDPKPLRRAWRPEKSSKAATRAGLLLLFAEMSSLQREPESTGPVIQCAFTPTRENTDTGEATWVPAFARKYGRGP